MSSRAAAISRSRAASREATPTPSRAVSRFPSCNELNEESISIIINPVQVALPSYPLSFDNSVNSSLQLSSRRRSDPTPPWRGSFSNLTSADSTPSSELSPDSGQATDSPLAGPGTSTGFASAIEEPSSCLYHTPIVGYEVLEERARFTVFKIKVSHQPSGNHWFVFHRYTDFAHLNRTLRKEFPGVHFALPPKRWFGNNFDPIFLEDRQLDLQAFINNIIDFTRIREKKCVRDFFCLDNPTGPHDTLEESQAMYQSHEETVSNLQDCLKEKESELVVLRSQNNFIMLQLQTLVKALRLECDPKSPVSSERSSSHELNLALLNMNGVVGFSQDTSPVQQGRVNSLAESPLHRTFDKTFLPRSCSHNTLSSTAAANGRAAKPLFVIEGDKEASR
ncbi:Sorting nexin-16 [Chionoecetes opilio]|uniref:Sorting nexin-16 n=1 Tax=Chionoecetes opilio TaxID=41210 RepID=A0A8J4XN23_CHIOP|nr:Sorting nexin-16 [Chionoecetes opilio]